MQKTFKSLNAKKKAIAFYKLLKPMQKYEHKIPILKARGYRPLQMTFDDQLKALIFFHLEEHTSGTELLQFLEQDDFARQCIAPKDGIKKSSFFEAINNRGLEQLEFIYNELQKEATKSIPPQFINLGELVAIDGSLITAVFSMTWADYRDGAKKAKIHLGFNINRSIPGKLFLTKGLASERQFVNQLLESNQTGVLDRGYQNHKLFDQWQHDGIQFVCRIKANTKKTCIKANPCKDGSIVFYDAIVLLGTPGQNQTIEPIRLVGYRIGNAKYWIATNRFDLSAEEIAQVYKLRWEIEKFFAWWKRHLKVYHLIARSEYGLMVQILSGLITYLLLAIYCQENYNEKVSIARVRELRAQIRNEARMDEYDEHINGQHEYDQNCSAAKT